MDPQVVLKIWTGWWCYKHGPGVINCTVFRKFNVNRALHTSRDGGWTWGEFQNHILFFSIFIYGAMMPIHIVCKVKFSNFHLLYTVHEEE